MYVKYGLIAAFWPSLHNSPNFLSLFTSFPSISAVYKIALLNFSSRVLRLGTLDRDRSIDLLADLSLEADRLLDLLIDGELRDCKFWSNSESLIILFILLGVTLIESYFDFFFFKFTYLSRLVTDLYYCLSFFRMNLKPLSFKVALLFNLFLDYDLFSVVSRYIFIFYIKILLIF